MCRDALNIQVCGCVREALVPHVNKQVVGSEKITSKDGLLDVCNDKDPPKCPTESQVGCKQSMAKGRDRGAIDGRPADLR